MQCLLFTRYRRVNHITYCRFRHSYPCWLCCDSEDTHCDEQPICIVYAHAFDTQQLKCLYISSACHPTTSQIHIPGTDTQAEVQLNVHSAHFTPSSSTSKMSVELAE